MGRSVGVEHVAATGAGPMRVSSPVMPVHRHRHRDPFRSRDLHADWRLAKKKGVRCQSSVEPTRQRSHKKSRRTHGRTYEGNLLPTWRQQPTNWWHGSPDGHDLSGYDADHRSRRAGSRGRPFRDSSPLRPTFLMLLRSHGALWATSGDPGSARGGHGEMWTAPTHAVQISVHRKGLIQKYNTIRIIH